MRALTLSAILLGLATTAASATVSITALPAGTMMDPVLGAGATFDSLTANPFAVTTPYGAFSQGGASFSGSGYIQHAPADAGFYAVPTGDNTNFLAVPGYGVGETITYSVPTTAFGLYWGSVDIYNTLTFYNGSNVVYTANGATVLPAVGSDNGTVSAYVEFSSLPQFTSVVLTSSQNAFEVDNVVAAVPEASTWVMMLLGFVGLGAAGYTSRRRPVVAA